MNNAKKINKFWETAKVGDTITIENAGKYKLKVKVIETSPKAIRGEE